MLWVFASTRPELVKQFPIVTQLRADQRPVLVISTGQHTALAAGMPLQPDISLDVPGTNNPESYVHESLAVLTDWASGQPRPDWIVVQGDTASALAAAHLGHHDDIPVCHVEAGLRSFRDDDPWPEERFRIEIDQLATLRCAPTVTALGNLLAENLQRGSHITGNPITDALRLMGCGKLSPAHVLVTLHRRESFGRDMQQCVSRLLTLSRQHPDTPFLWPLHPNPRVREALHGQRVPPNVQIAPPMPYREFLDALCHASCVITDSGGLVEECTTLGIPSLICRNVTERPEALSHGSTLVGREGATLAASFPPAPTSPSFTFGDGFCAPRITRLLT
jgi:UDP-N-acetylglucosamine 2-epimerase (non-hydrolysing)